MHVGRLATILMLTLFAACRGKDEPAQDRGAQRAPRPPAEATRPKDAAASAPATAEPAPPTAPAEARAGRAAKTAAVPAASPGPSQVVALIVLDAVRADRTSLCGHPRETTRYLTRLRDELSASTSCQFYAPSPHARNAIGTLMTGELPATHGLDARFVADAWQAQQTLAERYAEQGWQTVLVTGRGDLLEKPGPADGYTTVVGTGDAPLRGEAFARAVREVVQAADSRPLFLTLVISDAREPWGEMGDEAGFLGPRPPFALDLHDPNGQTRNFVRGGLNEDQRARLLENVRSHYDYGVRTADSLVRDALSSLEKRRGTREDVRAVVVGSSGFFLGERDRLGEASWVWEPAVKVPFLYFDTGRAEPFPPLPEAAASTTMIRSLLENGVLPRPTPLVIAYSSRERGLADNGDDMIAIWQGKQKLVWWRGVQARYALADDPEEHVARLPYTSDLRTALDASVPPVEAWMAWHDAELANRGLALPPRAPVKDPLPD